MYESSINRFKVQRSFNMLIHFQSTESCINKADLQGLKRDNHVCCYLSDFESVSRPGSESLTIF